MDASSTDQSKDVALIDSNSQTEYSNKKIFYDIFNCTYQTFLGFICLDACMSISLSYVARDIGEVQNAGLGLAFTCMYVLVIPIAFGINQSLNMHTSQALGQNQNKLAKSYLLLNICLICLAMIPLCGILYALKVPISYTIAEQDRDGTIEAAWDFQLFLMPAMVISMLFECIKTFMISHQLVYPFTFIHLFTTSAHLFMCWLMISKLELGITGAGIAILTTELLNFAAFGVFLLARQDIRAVFDGVSFHWKNVKRLIPEYLKSSFPIIVHIYSEFFVFFLLSFIALSLDTEQVNAHLAIQNTSGFCFRLPISLQLALMSFVGNEMGQLNISNAKRYSIAGLIIFLITTAIIVGFLAIFHNAWADFYTTNPNVKVILVDVLPWMILGLILIDGLQGTINGALKGIEKQNLVTYSTLIAYYVVCIPVVLIFTYEWGLGLKVKGIWMGFGIANAILLILYATVLFTTDWELQAQKIQQRVIAQNKLRASKASQIQQE